MTDPSHLELADRESANRVSRPAFLALCLASGITAVGFTGMQTVLPAIGREIGLPDSLVSAVFALASLLILFASPFWARLSDFRGRKAIILVGVTGFVVSMLGCALVVSAGIHRLATPTTIFFLFLFARGISGAVGGATPPATQAYVADNTGREERTSAIATLAGSAGVGTIIGPMAAPLMAQGPLGLAGPLYGFTAAGLLVLIVSWVYIPKDRPIRGPRARGADRGDGPENVTLAMLWRNLPVRELLIASALTNVIWMAVTQTTAFAIIDMTKVGPAASLPYITKAMIVGSLATVAGQWMVIPLLKPMPRNLLRWGTALALAGCILILLAARYEMLVAGLGIFMLGISLARPGLSAATSLSVTRAQQASAAGMLSAVMGGSTLFSPLFVLFYGLHHAGPFLLISLTLAAMLIFMWASPHLRHFQSPDAQY